MAEREPNPVKDAFRLVVERYITELFHTYELVCRLTDDERADAEGEPRLPKALKRPAAAQQDLTRVLQNGVEFGLSRRNSPKKSPDRFAMHDSSYATMVSCISLGIIAEGEAANRARPGLRVSLYSPGWLGVKPANMTLSAIRESGWPPPKDEDDDVIRIFDPGEESVGDVVADIMAGVERWHTPFDLDPDLAIIFFLSDLPTGSDVDRAIESDLDGCGIEIFRHDQAAFDAFWKSLGWRERIQRRRQERLAALSGLSEKEKRSRRISRVKDYLTAAFILLCVGVCVGAVVALIVWEVFSVGGAN